MREEREKAEAETAEKARAWAEAKAKKKADITRIASKAREKVDPEAKVMARMRERDISAKRVAEEA